MTIFPKGGVYSIMLPSGSFSANLNKINIDENDEDNLEYRNMATLDETLNWSKDFFV